MSTLTFPPSLCIIGVEPPGKETLNCPSHGRDFFHIADFQGGIWEEHFVSLPLTSWLITQDAVFSAEETVLIFDSCELDAPNSFFFDPCSTMCLKANLLQFTIEENHHLNGSCRLLFFLKNYLFEGGKSEKLYYTRGKYQ